MGQAKSRRRGGTTPPSNPETPSQMDLTLLPQELLVLILSWVPGRTLVTVGRLVCRQWRDLIDSPTLWKLQAERDPSKREAFRAALEAAPHCPCMEWGRVGVLQPFGRNLIKNPCGEEEFQHWQVGHGGGLCLGNLCVISQVIDLVKEGLWEDLLDIVQPDIFVSDWWGTHEKCGCTYTLYVVLQGAHNKSMARFETKINPAGSAEEGNVPFQQASHVFRKYGPGVREVSFQHLGSHPTAEQTEPHITNSTVQLLPPPPGPPAGRGSFRFAAGRRPPAGPDCPVPLGRSAPPPAPPCLPTGTPHPLGAKAPAARTSSSAGGAPRPPAMGQARSRRRGRGRTPPSSPETPSRMDSTLLPQELLVLILSWVPGRTLVTVGRLVCRQWRDLIDSPTLWKLQAERDPSKREAFRAALEAAPHCPRMEWGRVGVLQPFGRNLIKDPHGEKFQHWECRGLCTENGLWTTQVIDLVKEGLWEDLLDNVQPDIFVSDWWGTREKCQCTYTLHVFLQGLHQRSIATFCTEINAAGSAEDGSVPLQQASHVFRKYGPGVREVSFHHSVRNPTTKRAEPHITNATVMVKFSG